jgi:small subunit ribosomal protein S21
MLKVNVKHGNIEKALKILKNKVKNTKQKQILNNLKDYTKPSVERREEKLKAIYNEQKRRENDE